MTKPSNNAMQVWVQLFRAHARARAAVDAALKTADLPPLEHYDILWELERAQPGGLRPYEMERALLLPQYGVSRLVDRLSKDGLVTRTPCPEDGRGFRLHITDKGQALRQKMWEIYGPVIAQATAPLSNTEATALSATLPKLASDAD